MAQVKQPNAGMNFGKAPAGQVSKARTNLATPRPNAVTSTIIREVLAAAEVTIAPGEIKFFEAAADFSGATEVSLALTHYVG
jgi:hypothetical protein